MRERINPTYISKVLLSVFLVGIILPGLCFAQEQSVSSSAYEWLHVIVGLLSWIRIFFANLAGKFMTNSAIYGSFLHLDKFFITWWDLMRNLANFSLFAIFLYKVVQAMIGQKINELKKTFGKLLIAGVLIQSSWFIMGAVLDVSNIMTTALGTLPAQVINSNPSFESSATKVYSSVLQEKIQININWLDGDNKNNAKITHERNDLDNEERQKIIDSFLPSYNSLSGPLIFLGISILKIPDMPHQEHSNYDFSDLLIDIGIDGLILFIFSIALFLLFILNFLRVFVLWVIIPFSPMIVLLYMAGIKLKSIDNFLNIGRILKLIFMPVIMVTYLSIILMFIVSIKSILQFDESFEHPESNIKIDSQLRGEVYDTKLSSDGLFSLEWRGVKDTMADLFLYFFTLFLLWKMVMMMFSTKTGFSAIDKTMSGLTSTANKMAGSIGVLPLPTGGTISTRGISQGLDKIKSTGIAALNQRQVAQDTRFQKLFSGGQTDTDIAKDILKNYSVMEVMAKKVEVQSGIKQELSQKNSQRITDSPMVMSFLADHSGGVIEKGHTMVQVSTILNRRREEFFSDSGKTYREVVSALGFNKEGKFVGTGGTISDGDKVKDPADKSDKPKNT